MKNLLNYAIVVDNENSVSGKLFLNFMKVDTLKPKSFYSLLFVIVFVFNYCLF